MDRTKYSKSTNNKKKKRDPKRFYTKSPYIKGEGSLPQLNKHNNKKLGLLKVGEKYEFCQNKIGQVDVDERYDQYYAETRIEWYHGVRKKKYFIITDIKEGFIEGIPSKFNGYILILERVP
jgi:hypothetical protein